MQAEELITIVRRIQKTGCEMQNIEVKAAEYGCPTRLYDTLSSFSNQDDGGIIIFGLSEADGFRTVGVYDPQDLQKKITEQCKQMEPLIRALFTVCEVDNHIVVSAEIPGVDISIRPVFYKGVGRIKGSFLRVGESDEPMSEYEIYSYDAFRKRIRDDIRIAEGSKRSLLDNERVRQYLETVKRERKNLAENVLNEEILELMGILNNGIPTLAGILTLSRYPQGLYPQLCITAVSVPGLEMGQTGEEGERFIDNQRITGSIPDMLEEAVDFIRKNSRMKTVINDDGKRRDQAEYPLKAVREVVLNALVHRDYSIHTENVPIRIEMYRDRMMVISSGGLYGKITIDSLGAVRPETRNAALANVLELMKVTENRYSGIPTIRNEFRNAGLPAPIFEIRHGEFIVTLKNNIYKSENKPSAADMSGAVLEFCQVPRSRAEIEDFTGFSRFYTMSSIVAPLLESGRLQMTLPDKPKSSKQKYYKV